MKRYRVINSRTNDDGTIEMEIETIKENTNFVQALETLEEEVVDDADVEVVWDPLESYAPAECYGPRPDEYDIIMLNGVLTPHPREGSDWMKRINEPDYAKGVWASDYIAEIWKEYTRRYGTSFRPRGGNIYFDTDL